MPDFKLGALLENSLVYVTLSEDEESSYDVTMEILYLRLRMTFLFSLSFRQKLSDS